MAKRHPGVSSIATHLVAAGLGLAVWWSVKPGDVAETGGAESESGAGFKSSSRKSDRSGRGLSGEELLTRISGHSAEDMGKKDPHEPDAAGIRRRMDEIAKWADELKPADDLAGAASAAMEKLLATEPYGPGWEKISKEAAARMLHWLREDPKAAMATNFKRQDKTGAFEGVLSVAVKETGVLAAAEWFGVNPMADTDLRTAISFIAASDGDLGVMSVLKDRVPPARWGDMRTAMAQAWPLEKADTLLEFAKQENAPAFVLLFTRTQGKAGFDWLRQQMAAGTIDPELREQMVRKPEFRDLYLTSPHVPIEERMAALQPEVGANDPNQIENLDSMVKQRIAFQDVRGALMDRDWRYAFRHGAATLDEVVADVSTRRPDLAKDSPELLRSRVIDELAEENGSAVLAALSHLAPEERWERAMGPAERMFWSSNPQELFDYVRQIPEDAGETMWERRMQIWTNHTAGSSRRFGKGYIDWVKSLPPGLDRDMAAYTVARQLNDADAAAALRAEIRDPRLVAKLEGEQGK